MTRCLPLRRTVEFLGEWEPHHNPDSKPLEFEGFKTQARPNGFSLSPNALPGAKRKELE
jgi:hypothetical protein